MHIYVSHLTELFPARRFWAGTLFRACVPSVYTFFSTKYKHAEEEEVSFVPCLLACSGFVWCVYVSV